MYHESEHFPLQLQNSLSVLLKCGRMKETVKGAFKIKSIMEKRLHQHIFSEKEKCIADRKTKK